MMKSYFLYWMVFLGILGAGTSRGVAQKYYVYFADKSTSIDPTSDFTPQALERRARHQVHFPAATDYPLNPHYIQAVESLVDSIRFELRWWNALSVQARPHQLAAIEGLPFVAKVEPVPTYEVRCASTEAFLPRLTADKQKDTLYRMQRNLLGLDRLAEEGLDGSGVRIAVFDAGFRGANEHPGLAHLYERKQVLKTRDFYRGGTKVYRGSEHGTAVLSCIGGVYQDAENIIGAAPQAEFLLARTEHRWMEKIKEEDCWLAAMEWADREGADIISSSLGYDSKRYTYADMTGQTTRVTQAAQLATRKGILVVNSAGNTGDSNFHYVSAPGDADSVLTVGASHPMMRYPMLFTAYGPNARGTTKPDVAGPGYVVACAQNGGYDIFAGTSFACPLVAGVAACLLQYQPNSTNMDVHRKIRQLGHWYPYYDYRLGFGIPWAPLIWDERPEPDPTFKVIALRDTFFVVIDSTVLNRNLDAFNGKPCHYSVRQSDGKLALAESFRLIRGQEIFAIPEENLPEGQLRIWWEGYLWEEKME